MPETDVRPGGTPSLYLRTLWTNTVFLQGWVSVFHGFEFF